MINPETLSIAAAAFKKKFKQLPKSVDVYNWISNTTKVEWASFDAKDGGLYIAESFQLEAGESVDIEQLERVLGIPCKRKPLPIIYSCAPKTKPTPAS